MLDRSHEKKRCQDKWLTDETYFEKSRLNFLPLIPLDLIEVGKTAQFCCVVGQWLLDDFTESNTTGLFLRKARGVDPYSNQSRIVWGYYVTAPGGLVERPPDGKKSFLPLLQYARISDWYSVAWCFSDIVDLTREIQLQSRAKRKAKAAAVADEEAANKKPMSLPHPAGSASARILVESYWDSPEAKKLFLGSSSDDRCVLEVLQQRTERLQQVHKTS